MTSAVLSSGRRDSGEMQYILPIYENEKVYGPDKTGPAQLEIVSRLDAVIEVAKKLRLGDSSVEVRPLLGPAKVTFRRSSIAGRIARHILNSSRGCNKMA